MLLNRPQFFPGPDGVVPTLDNCLGYYDALDEKGELVGPLVGYAGTYRDNDGTQKAYVGHKFYNFAMAEQWPFVLDEWTQQLMSYRFRCLDITAFLGAPMGGLATAQALARAHVGRTRYVYAEKEIIELKTATSREQSILRMNRHVLLPGDIVAGVEDVVNNFSTTDKVDELVTQAGANLKLIVCILNRSEKTEFVTKSGKNLPVVSLCHLPTEQYRQDDPIVADQIAKGNIVWKPKDAWFDIFIPRILAAKRK